MSGINNTSGGVGSPFKAKLGQMPAGASALKQVEEETKTFKENVQSIVGGVGGAVGNIEQGITNFLTSIGLPPRVEKETSFDADQATIDKARKRIGVSQFQWDTGAGIGVDAHKRMAIDREKKELGLYGKVVEIENPNFNPDEEISETNPEKVNTREYNEFNILTGKTDRYVYDPVTGQYNIQASVNGGVGASDVETTEQTAVEETVDNDFKKDITDYATTIDHENIPDWKEGDEISEEVKVLQEGLISIYGEDILPVDGADGRMGPETRNAIEKLLSGDEGDATVDKPSDTTVDKPSDQGFLETLVFDKIPAGDVETTLGANVSEEQKIQNIKEVQQTMIDLGADISYTKDGNKVEGADGDWGPRSQQAYEWYMDGKDMKNFKYKPSKKKEQSDQKISTATTVTETDKFKTALKTSDAHKTSLGDYQSLLGRTDIGANTFKDYTLNFTNLAQKSDAFPKGKDYDYLKDRPNPNAPINMEAMPNKQILANMVRQAVDGSYELGEIEGGVKTPFADNMLNLQKQFNLSLMEVLGIYASHNNVTVKEALQLYDRNLIESGFGGEVDINTYNPDEMGLGHHTQSDIVNR